MTDKLYSIRHTKDFDIQTTTLNETWEIVLNPVAIREGAIKNLGANSTILLIAIASYMDGEGKCFPTQEQLAEVLGWSARTVRDTLKKLLNAEHNGQRLLERELLGGMKKHSQYTMVKVESEPPVSKRKTAKDFISLFCHKYNEVYGVQYNPTWAKDSSMVKKKLIDLYDDETIIKVIEYIFANYDQKWSNAKYPRPTVGSACTWLFNAGLTEVQTLEKKQVKIETEIKKDTTEYDTIFDDFI